MIRFVSQHGEIELPAIVTDEIISGTVAVPHGWGPDGRDGWTKANAGRGVNVNLLALSAVDDLERLAGMTLLDGISVRIERAAHVGSASPR